MESGRKFKKVKFIYNPNAGETKVADKLDEIVELYQKHGYMLIPYRLTFKGDPMEMLHDVGRGYHHILIAGGDGTVNHVVNLMKSKGINLPIAVLPAGTANDFASALGVDTTNIVKACKGILEGEIVPIDLGIVNGTYFVNVFSCGLFTDVSQKTPTILKNTFGKLAYYVGGLGELTHFRRMHVKIESDGGNYEGGSVIFFVFNGRTAGKLKIAYLSEIDDGLLDVLILKGDSPLENVQTLMHYLTTAASQKAAKEYPHGMVHLRCSRLVAECDGDEATDIDGQAGPSFPLEILCEKGGLKVLRPKPGVKKKRKRTKALAGTEK